MGQAVLKCTHAEIAKMKRFYKPYIQPKNPPASEFFAKPPGCAVTAYRSGKVLFQGQNAEQEAFQWQSSVPKPVSQKKQPESTIWTPPEDVGMLSVIGSDEVGTGDYFGPITVVAVFIDKDQLSELRKIGLKDSKLLNDAQICRMAETIIPQVKHKLLVLPNAKYNDLRDKGMTQGKMKAMMHNQALRNVIRQLDEIPYDGILIDQFAAPDVYFKYLQGQPEIVRERTWFRTKAESLHLSVAAASIIARKAFVDEMDRLSEDIGMELPKGAGAHVDEAAGRLIEKKGVEVLRDVAKLHFANTKRAVRLAKR